MASSQPAAPAVSVVIPAYNATRNLGATLNSVAAQTFRDFEVIVVDDGSTDDTAALARGFEASFPALTVVTKANGGVSLARNHALRLARGELVASLDSDDLWHPTYLEKLVARFREGGPETVLCYSFKRVVDLDDNVRYTPTPLRLEGHVFHRIMQTNPVSNGSGILFSREAAARAGNYEETYQAVSDGYIQVRLAAIGKVVCVPEYLVGYRSVPDSISTDKVRMGLERLGVTRLARREFQHLDARVYHAVMAERAARFMKLTYADGNRRAALRFFLAGLPHDPGHLWTVARKLWRRSSRSAAGRADATTGRNFFSIDVRDPLPADNVQTMKQDAFRLATEADAAEAKRRGLAY